MAAAASNAVTIEAFPDEGDVEAVNLASVVLSSVLTDVAGR